MLQIFQNSTQTLETFVILLGSHLVADYPLQFDWIVRRKSKVLILGLHTLIVAIITAIFLGNFTSWALAILLVSHFLIDSAKSRFGNDGIALFTIDQLLHLLVLVLIALQFPDLARSGIWYRNLPPPYWQAVVQGLTAVSGIIIIIAVGGIVIKKTAGTLLKEHEPTGAKGLENGGKYIGWLERGLIFLLIAVNVPAGIGFLIAAKSILRFGEIKESKHRAVTEYIIIGTFMSFGWAILWTYLTLLSIRAW